MIKFYNTLLNRPIRGKAMQKKTYNVKVKPTGISISSSSEETLLEALTGSGIQIESVCGGKGTCGKCALKILEGKVSPLTGSEERWRQILGKEFRLACQVRAMSDIVIELENSFKAKAKILTWGHDIKYHLDPLVREEVVELEKPSLKDQEADLDRLLNRLHIEGFDPLIVREVSERLWSSGFRVDGIIFGDELVDVLPEGSGGIYGIAFDIGTTTVVGYLYDLSSGRPLAVRSRFNEQIKFGEDVISRIEYASRDDEGLARMHQAVISTMNGIIEELLADSRVHRENIYDVVCAGNTVMTSFLLRNSCYHSSKAPYIPPFKAAMKVKARDLNIKVSSRGYVRTLPLISAYVGGDLVGDILVSEIFKQDTPSALIDLGTNGEVVLKAGKEFLAASCAAGPALEGYSIRNGMRAMSGAIESVSIGEDGEVYYRTVGGEKPLGICGSGIIEAVAWMRIRGVLDKSGRILEDSSKRVVREGGELEFVIADERASSSRVRIAITQSDIRKIQLAKAAIFSTLVTLSKIAGIALKEVERLYIAGAFGTYTDPFYATVIGLLPELPREKYVQIGNGSGAGASLLLLSKRKWDDAIEVSKKVRVIELNLVEFFKDEFINATYIPHRDEELFKATFESIKPFAKT